MVGQLARSLMIQIKIRNDRVKRQYVQALLL